MDKLLQYLNEYEREISKFPVPWSYTRGMLQYWSFIPQVSITYAISKKYWFINWLFEKDKINKKKNWYTVFGDANPTNQWWPEFSAYSDVESLLMILAIYEPLDILIDILR